MNAASAKLPVLLVEDNPDNRQLFEKILETEYEMVACDNGPAALALLAQRAFRLVLMDIAMPGMDGVETLTRWRSDPTLPRVPVIALTAHAMTGDRERLLALGFDGYLSKPVIDEVDLLSLAGSLIRGHA
jgi:CheY-like chemotaxis protein